MILGMDVSHWSGAVNFAKAKAAGAFFSFSKLTDGEYPNGIMFTDSKADHNIKQAHANGLLSGAYAWLQPKLDPGVQANYFVEQWNKYKAWLNMPPVVDFEDKRFNSPQDYAWRCQEWIRVVQQATGIKPIIYTARWFTDLIPVKYASWMTAYPVWVAHYTSSPKPIMPRNLWSDYTFWQFSADGNRRGAEFGCQSGDVDLNVFNGSLADMQAFCGVTEPPVVTLTLEERVKRLEDLHGL